MHPRSGLDWEPPGHWHRVAVIDSHTGGEPFRVVIEGVPEIPGDTMLARRRYAEEHLDGLRRALMWEPRGHADMYGGWLGPGVRPDSDLSVLFTHNDGFSTMCGHGIIALTKVVFDTGIFETRDRLRIDTPAGQVVATPTVEDGLVTFVSFINVPSFVVELDARVEVPGLGELTFDLAFGGAFYAYVDAGLAGVSFDDVAGLISVGRKIKTAIMGSRTVRHPEDPDLGFLYGVIFTGRPVWPGNHSRHACVFADGELDRSPTGTGVSGRLAILAAMGEPTEGRVIIESIVGSVFTGRVVGNTTVDGIPAVIPEVGGTAHILGRSELWFDPEDPLAGGFLLR